MATVVFVHAHPDDEAIFTGATMARLAGAGHRVVLVVATGGELGAEVDDPLLEPEGHGGGPFDGVVDRSDAPDGGATARSNLAAIRRRETEAAAELLGIARVVLLGHRDSGMAGDPANEHPASLWATGHERPGEAVAAVLAEEGADAVVAYDPRGIYGHPDHVRVHELGWHAARLAGTPSVYEATVDREHLHFVETHLVEEAILAGDLGLVRSHLGTPTVEITTEVSAAAALDVKRRAMAAHASQIPPGAPVLALPDERFALTYGLEWYVRHGPRSALDDLG